jgi:hypothetical protein
MLEILYLCVMASILPALIIYLIYSMTRKPTIQIQQTLQQLSIEDDRKRERQDTKLAQVELNRKRYEYMHQ